MYRHEFYVCWLLVESIIIYNGQQILIARLQMLFQMKYKNEPKTQKENTEYMNQSARKKNNYWTILKHKKEKGHQIDIIINMCGKSNNSMTKPW